MKKLLLLGLCAVTICTSSCKENESAESAQEDGFYSQPDLDRDENSRPTSGSNTNNPDVENTNSNATTETNDKVNAGDMVSSPGEPIKRTDPIKTPTTNYKASVITSSSVILFSSSGKQDKLSFGQPAATVIQKMNQYIGKPSSDEVDTNCNGKQVRTVQWEEHITLHFTGAGSNSPFSGWNLQSRDEYAPKFKTTSGLTVGKIRNELSAPLTAKPTKTSLGYLQQTEGVNAIFSTPDKDALLTYLFAGVNCYAIEEGKTPESEKN